MAELYGEDLAHIQVAGFGAMAEAVGPQVVALLHEQGIRSGTIGDIGCGAGVTTRRFLDAGFDVWALEPSAALLAAARARAPEATFLPRGSVYEATLQPADAIFAIGEPLSYHAPQSDADERVRDFFVRAAAALRPGGMLAFDVIVRGDVSLDGRSWHAGEDWAVLVETSETADCWLRREIETFVLRGEGYRRGRETHHVRVFDREQLTAALCEAGFDVQTSGFYRDYRLAPRRCAFLCRRVGGQGTACGLSSIVSKPV